MGRTDILSSLRLRAERSGLLLRARRRGRELAPVADRTAEIARRDILLFATCRNEQVRLAYFLDYYRGLGVRHFLIVDNDSSDGTAEYLAAQPDVSLWHTAASYKRARYGVDWMNWLLNRHAHGHWALAVDIDEFLVYPHMDSRPLPALTEWLDSCRVSSFGTLLLDMYSDRPVLDTRYRPGDDPFEQLAWFDAANYTFRRDTRYRNLWIQGGPRGRLFFGDDPAKAPALNKVPLVRWKRGIVYRSSTHTLMPRGLNQVYSLRGGEKICGVLLHAKFLDTFADKAREERARGQHYAASREYRVYHDKLHDRLAFWTPCSTRYDGWRQLVDLGLMSSGSWA